MKRYRPVLIDFQLQRLLLVVRRPRRKLCAVIKWVPFARVRMAYVENTMTFHEFYLQDRERFLQAITEVNWEAVALAADDEDSLLIAALIRGPLYDEIKDTEANSDLEPARQAADDVLAQSRRQDATEHHRRTK